MFYQITATVTKKTADGTTSIQVPTFFLNGNVQGIVGIDHAEQIAKEVINPTKDDSVTVNAYVCTVYDNTTPAVASFGGVTPVARPEALAMLKNSPEQ